jgi:hypothetical protein
MCLIFISRIHLLGELIFKGLTNSKFLVYYFAFSTNEYISNLNSSIFYFQLEVFNLKLNSQILSKYVFEKLESLFIKYHLDSIESEVFKDLKHFKSLSFLIFSMQRFF